MPPLLLVASLAETLWPLSSSQALSPTQTTGEVPVVVKDEPPTCVMLGLSDGSVAVPSGNEPSSPVALKKDWPCACICLNSVSEVESAAVPPPQEQLNCLMLV